VHIGFWCGFPRGRDHLKDLGVDGRIILECILKNVVSEGVDWIDLLQDRDKWRAVVETVMNLRVSYSEEQAFIR